MRYFEIVEASDVIEPEGSVGPVSPRLPEAHVKKPKGAKMPKKPKASSGAMALVGIDPSKLS